MSEYQAIEDRYGIRVPETYQDLRRHGHLDWHGPDSSPDYLFLTDLEWLRLDEIAGYDFFDWQIGGLVPFAISARRDEWCWRLDWQDGPEPPVVLCERGSTGFGYAPDFRGFLFRILLEELSGSWLLEDPGDAEGRAQVCRSVQIASPFLPSAWAERLRLLTRQDWREFDDGAIGVFPRSECNDIVARELAFGHLDEEFSQDKRA